MTLGHPSPPAPTKKKSNGKQRRKWGGERRGVQWEPQSQQRRNSSHRELFFPPLSNKNTFHQIRQHYGIYYTDGIIRTKDVKRLSKVTDSRQARPLFYPQWDHTHFLNFTSGSNKEMTNSWHWPQPQIPGSTTHEKQQAIPHPAWTSGSPSNNSPALMRGKRKLCTSTPGNPLQTTLKTLSGTF